jgi:beta-lactam-binding protein with PASTA domain
MRARTARPILAILLVALAVALAGCGPKVPDVTGMVADDAVRALQDAGYKLGDITIMYTSGLKSDTVAAQNPNAGERLKEGQAVSLQIAKALGAIDVPNLTDMTEAEAASALTASMLVPQPVQQYSDTAAVGKVFIQVPDAGAKVDAGATVVFAISAGKAPATVAVPNIMGATKASADSALKSAGLVGGPYEAYSETVAAGLVAGQNPASGASVAPGAKVSYIVSLGKVPTGGGDVTVPNVTGKSQADAEAAVKAAGLVPSALSDTNAAAKGTVAGQMPPAGSKTAKGGVVGILVSLGPEAEVTVPDLKGMTADAAQAAVTAVGLVSYPVPLASADVPSGQVLGQQPPAGEKVPAGWPVMYAVSSGVPPATTP